MKAKSLICVAAVMVAGLFASQAEAAPGDVEFISTVNISGGTSLTNVATVFGPPTIVNIPGILQAGEFTFGPLTGTYYYYPAMRYTVFSGFFQGGGNVVSLSGYVVNDLPGPVLPPPVGSPGQVFASIYINGFGGLTGTHIGTSQ